MCAQIQDQDGKHRQHEKCKCQIQFCHILTKVDNLCQWQRSAGIVSQKNNGGAVIIPDKQRVEHQLGYVDGGHQREDNLPEGTEENQPETNQGEEFTAPPAENTHENTQEEENIT